MNLADCYYLGYISRVTDSKSRYTFVLDVDSPEDYKKLESVLIQLQKADESPVPFFIKRVTNLRNNELTVELDLSNQFIDPLTLKGKSLYLPLSKLKKKGKDDYYFHEIIGFEAEDEALGIIGIIKDVYDMVSHPVLSIDKDGKEILIPLHEGTFREVDRDKKIFRISAPEGLINFYLD